MTEIRIERASFDRIQPLRRLFLEECDFQIRYHACHERGWADHYLISFGDLAIGYAAIKGLNAIADRNALFEFHMAREYRERSADAFHAAVAASGASSVEWQSNERQLASLADRHACEIETQAVLFADATMTALPANGTMFRRRLPTDQIFTHRAEPIGDFIVELEGEIVGTGGFLTHYNPPFCDLFMEIRENSRRQGFGASLVQQLKTEARSQGLVPAARCGVGNGASRATLEKAGFGIAGFMRVGGI